MMKIRVPKPYGRYAVIALEQGFGSPDVFNCTKNTPDPLRDIMDLPSCNYLSSLSIRVDYAASDYDFNYPSSERGVGLKLCADRIRKVVPWKVISAALKELRDKNFVYNY